MLAMQAETHNSKRHYEQSEVIRTKQEQIATSMPRNDVLITIYDIYGREVKQLKYFIASNSEAISINVSNLQSGIYLVKIGTQTAKFVKE
jgi:hypothetical protein